MNLGHINVSVSWHLDIVKFFTSEADKLEDDSTKNEKYEINGCKFILRIVMSCFKETYTNN